MIKKIKSFFKNFFKKVLVFGIILLILNTIRLEWRNSRLEGKIGYLEADQIDIAELEAKVIKLQAKLDIAEYNAMSNTKKISSEYEKILKDIFWGDGIYLPEDKSINFYSDVTCQQKIKKGTLKFLSDRWLEYDRANGYVVFIYWSTKGPVYATEKLTFKKVS